MVYTESIHADRSLRIHLRPCDDGSDIRILFAEAAKTVAMNKAAPRNDYENYAVETHFMKQRYPDDYSVPQWTVQAPTASSASTVADPEDQYQYLGIARENRVKEFKPLSPMACGFPLSAMEEHSEASWTRPTQGANYLPANGRFYHQQLFARGQKVLERLAEDGQRNEILPIASSIEDNDCALYSTIPQGYRVQGRAPPPAPAPKTWDSSYGLGASKAIEDVMQPSEKRISVDKDDFRGTVPVDLDFLNGEDDESGDEVLFGMAG